MHGFCGSSIYKPCRESMWAKFSPTALTRTRTSTSPATGSGVSWILSTLFSPVPVVTICRIDQYYQFRSASSVLICRQKYETDYIFDVATAPRELHQQSTTK